MSAFRRIARNVLLVVCLGALGGFAVAKVFVWYEAHRAATRLAAWLAPYAAMSWESVGADVDGEVRLGGLTIRPEGIDDEIYIELLTVHAPGRRNSFTLFRSLSAGRLPETLRLGAQGLTLNVDGALYRRLARSGWWGSPIDALACADAENLRRAVLQAIGRGSIKADAEFRLRLHEATRRLSVYVDIAVPGLTATTADAMLTLAATTWPVDSGAPLSTLAPALTSLRLRYVDLGFNEARNYYCAAELDVPMEAFVDRHVAALRERLGGDDTPVAPLLTRYRSFATHGGDVLVDFMPVKPVPLATLRHIERAALIETMRPRLAINGRTVGVPASTWLPAAAPAPITEVGTASRADHRDIPTAIAAENLAAHLGATVRILTHDGAAHTGVIEAADAGALTLRRRLEGGYMSFSVNPGDIERVVQLSPPPGD